MLPVIGAVRALLSPVLRSGPLKLLHYQRPIICQCPTLSFGSSQRALISTYSSTFNDYPYGASTDQLRRIDLEAQFILEDYDQSRAIESLHHLRRMGYRSINGVVDSVCRLLIEEDRLIEAVLLTKDIVQKGFLHGDGLEQKTYHRLLKGFVEWRKATADASIASQFAEFVTFMNENNFELGALGYFNVMRMASLVGNTDLALGCFHELQDIEDYEVHVSEYGLLLQAYLNKARRTSKYDEIATVIGWCNEMLDKGYTASVIDILTTELIEDNQLDEAVNIVKDLIERCDIQVEHHTFTRLLKGFVDLRLTSDDSGIVNSFSDFVSYMVEHGYSIDVWDQFQMLRMAALDGNCQLAQEYFDELKTRDESNDRTAIYWLLIQAHMNAAEKNDYNDWDSVFSCFGKMLNDKSADISTDPVKLNQLLQMSSWHGRSELAQACFDGLQDNARHTIGSSDLGLLLQSYLNEARKKNKYDNHANIIHCFDLILSSGLELNQSVFKSSIEHLVMSNASQEAREAIPKLIKEANTQDHLDYLEDLVQIKQQLISGNEKEARHIARKSRYIVDCENFIASHRLPAKIVTRFGTGVEEKNKIMENFHQDLALQKLSILNKSGYRKVGHVMNDVVGDLIYGQRFVDALNLTKVVIEEDVIRVMQSTYLRLLKGFADHVKLNKGPESANLFIDFIDFMDSQGYLADEWVQIEKLRVAAILGKGEIAQACFDMLKTSEKFKIADRHYLLLLGALITDLKQNKSNENMVKVLGHFNVTCEDNDGIVFEDRDLVEVLTVASTLGDSKTAQLAFDKVKPTKMRGVHHGLLLQSFVNESRKTGKYENGEVVVQIFNKILDNNFDINSLTIKMFIESSIRSGHLQDAVVAIQKLTKDKDKYLDLFYLLNRIEQCLTGGDVKKAKTIANGSEFRRDCNRFINLALKDD